MTPTDPARWRRAEDLFHEIVQSKRETWEERLRHASGDDTELRAAVEYLLKHHEAAERCGFLQAPAARRPDVARDAARQEGVETDPCETPTFTDGLEVIQPLGSGGMGQVFLARQSVPMRYVAVKRIGPDAGSDAVERFRREVEAVGMLQHPNIVRVLEVGLEGRRSYFLMDYIEGVDLGAKLRAGVLSGPDAVKLLRPIVSAVKAAHDAGIVHRDLKPQNILLNAKGEPFLTDFGLAKFLSEIPSDLTLNKTVGTPCYMSPEQAGGRNHEVAQPTDIYSIGAILFEMLIGRPPFRADSPEETLRQVKSIEPVGLRKINPSIPLDLETICLKCLAKEPGKRYASAATLAEDLDRFLRGDPILARRPSWVERAWKWSWKHRAGMSIAAALLVALVVTAAGVGRWQSAQATRRQALLAEARGLRLGGEAGRRFEALANLENAARIAPSAELRDEAIASLTLVDLRPGKFWPANPTNGCAVDDDFQRYAVADSSGTLHVRSLDDDRIMQSLPGQGQTPFFIRFSSDGRWLGATYYADAANKKPANYLKIWDLNSGQPRLGLPRDVGVAWGFSPDGRAVAIADETRIAIYDLSVAMADAPKICEWETAPGMVRVEFAPDGRRLAVARDKPAEVELFDVPAATDRRDGATTPAVKRLRHEKAGETVRDIAWAPSGECLAVAAGLNISLWEPGADKPRLVLEGHQSTVERVTFSPAGDLLASYGWDDQTCLWNPNVSTPLVIVPGNNWLKFSRDGRRLAGAAAAPRVGVWDVVGNSEYRLRRCQLTRPGSYANYLDRGVWQIAFHPTVPLFASASIDGVRLWSLDQCDEPIGLIPMPLTSKCLFAPDGDALWISGRFGVVRWPLRVSAGVVRLGPPSWAEQFDPEEDRAAHELAVSRNSNCFAAVLDGGNRVAVLASPVKSPADRTVGKRIELVEPGHVRSVAFSPHGEWLATGSDAQAPSAVRIWRADGTLARKLPVDHAFVSFSPDGRWLATGSSREYRLFHTETWEPGPRMARSGASLRGPLAFSPDGRTLAVVRNLREVQLVEAATLQPLATLAASHGERPIVTSLSFSPDQRFLAAGCQGNWIHLWDLAALGKELSRMMLQPPEILSSAAREITPMAPPPVRLELLWHSSDVPPAAASVTHSPAADFSPASLICLGDAEAKAERWENAATYFQLAIQPGSDDTAVWRRVVLTQLQRDDFAGARETLRSMRERLNVGHTHESKHYLWLHAIVVDAGGDRDALLAQARQRVAQHPESRADVRSLGALLFRFGRWEEAVPHLLHAQELHSIGGNPTDWLFLAMAHFRCGDIATAQRELEHSYVWMHSEKSRTVYQADWQHWSEYEVLFREASRLISAKHRLGD